MPKTSVYLHFGGNCADAMRFYEQTLGGKITSSMTYGEAMPDKTEPRWQDKIIHCEMDLDGAVLMASDGPPHYQAERMAGFSIALQYPNEQEAHRIFDALAAGGQITMPFAKTFFSEGFGMLQDKFGTPWMVDTAVPATANV